MNHETLADRLVNYADAVTAFSVVNSLAFLVALSETDVRCSLADRQNFVVGGQIATGFIVTMAVLALRRSELKVRASTQLPNDIARYLRVFFLVRLAVIAAATVLSVTSAVSALTDSACETPTAERAEAAATSSRALPAAEFADWLSMESRIAAEASLP